MRLFYCLTRTCLLRLYQIDAFTSRPFSGNPAAVMLLEHWLDDAMMQAIAMENNLAETAFAVRSGDLWHLRWFTPTQEVDFCGHATLATAHAIFTEYPALQEVAFDSRAGQLSVSRDGDHYAMSMPRLDPQRLDSLPACLRPMFETAPKALFQNAENLFVVMDDPQALRDFRPDFGAMAPLGTTGLVITAQAEADNKADFLSRSFAPGVGIDEDPVTGSTHSTLTPYWADVLGKDSLLAYQASARGGWLGCRLHSTRVILTGQAVTFLTGDITL